MATRKNGQIYLASAGTLVVAADAVVDLVSRYFADYRELLRNDDMSRAALVTVLDTFVLAGWPQAWKLTYKLGDIDR